MQESGRHVTNLFKVLTSHGMLLAVFLGFTVWYMADVWMASSKLQNVVLILPVGIVAAIFAITLLLRAIRAPGQLTRTVEAGTFPMIALIAAYVGGLVVIGFSAATFLFLVSASWLLGMRRPLVLVVFAAGFTALVVLGLSFVVRIPEPLVMRCIGGL